MTQSTLDPTLHDLLTQRYSTYAYAPRAVEPDKLRSVLEAARRAPSSFNGQPWHFVVASRDDTVAFERMLACLVEKNQEWARNAGILMISVATLNFEHNDKPNRHALHDVGLATMSMMIQATHLGLYLHAMAGFSVEAARDTLGIPAGFEPVAAMALGYRASLDGLSEEARAREVTRRPRRALEEIAFSGGWGSPFG